MKSISPLGHIVCTEWKWWIPGAILSFLLASVLMSGWPTGLLPNLDYPYINDSTGLFFAWLIKRAHEGWILYNDRSGYPFGSTLYDFPGADSGNPLILKLIGLLTPHYFAIFNLYFLLGFAVTFIASFCVLRTVGLTLFCAFSAAILFNFAPFHFLRIRHLTYTWYFVIPLFYYISLRIFYSDPSNLTIKPTFLKKLSYALGLIILGSFGVYYSVFGIIMLLTVAISKWVGEFNLKAIRLACIAIGFVGAGILLNLTPSLIYWHSHGRNPEATQQQPAESEDRALKLMQLIIPRLYHRNQYLANLSINYLKLPVPAEGSKASLGIIGSLGLMSVFFIIAAALSGRRINKLLGIVSLMVLVLFMFGTVGGLGSLLAYAVSPLIRAWARVSIFIAFGALLSLFILLQTGIKKHFARWEFILLPAVATAFLLIGLYDQTVPANKAHNTEAKRVFNLDRDFIQTIEKSLPAGSGIYQLPYLAFPEGRLSQHFSYQLVEGFLHSTSLRWSYGGMRGREADLFYRRLAQAPLKTQLEVIRRLGFAGIYIDNRGFADNGKAVIAGLTALLGKPPTLTRSDGEIVFFRLDHNPPVNLQGLSAAQIMDKAGFKNPK